MEAGGQGQEASGQWEKRSTEKGPQVTPKIFFLGGTNRGEPVDIQMSTSNKSLECASQCHF